MNHVREQDVAGERFPPPHAREIKHLVAPWNVGARNLWAGITSLERDSTSNAHLHENSEEVFYVLSGTGLIRVGNEEEAIAMGSCIFIPPNTMHQLVNTGAAELRVLAVTSPPFTQDGFKSTHTPKT